MSITWYDKMKMPTLAAGQSLSNVAEILHAAIVFGPAAWKNQPLPEAHLSNGIEANLRKDLLDLFGLLHTRHVPYLLVGGIAMLTYVDGRNTKDVDLVLSVTAMDQLSEITVSDRNRDFARGTYGTLQVDVLLTSNPLFQLVNDHHATIHRFFEIDICCATVEGLLILKLYALPSLYRQGDGQRIGLYENDIFMLCERYRPKMLEIFDTLKVFVDSDELRELNNIVADIYTRIERVDRLRNRP